MAVRHAETTSLRCDTIQYNASMKERPLASEGDERCSGQGTQGKQQGAKLHGVPPSPHLTSNWLHRGLFAELLEIAAGIPVRQLHQGSQGRPGDRASRSHRSGAQQQHS